MVLIRDILASGDGLRAFCERPGCGHWSVLDPGELVHGWGEALTVADVKRMLRCTACGARAAAVQRFGGSPDFNVSHAFQRRGPS